MLLQNETFLLQLQSPLSKSWFWESFDENWSKPKEHLSGASKYPKKLAKAVAKHWEFASRHLACIVSLQDKIKYV